MSRLHKPATKTPSPVGLELNPKAEVLGVGEGEGLAARPMMPIRPMPDPDLPLLHTLMSHYALQLWDVQKVRIAMGNRVAAMKRDGLDKQWTLPIESACNDLKRTERGINRELVNLAKTHPLCTWVEQTPGLGLAGFGRLMGIVGSLDKFPNVAKLWRYLGLAVVDGRRERKHPGQRVHFSPQGQVLCHQIGDSIVKLGRGPYRGVYDDFKAKYLARERIGPSECLFGAEHRDKKHRVVKCRPGHPHNAAMRVAVKKLVKDMWVEWRRSRACCAAR